MKHGYPILYFDGVCNLCNATVQWVIKRDKQEHFRFASLQSEVGQSMLMPHFPEKSMIPNSVLLEIDGRLYAKSSAAIKLLQMLGGVYKLSVIAWAIPRFIRDAVYDFIARNRYKWYGKRDSCMLPTPELKSRFLD